MKRRSLSSEWKSAKIMDLCREITVGHVGPMADQYVDEGIPFLRSQNILPFYLDLTEVKYITEDFHQKLRKSTIRPGDVVVVRTGYPGTACVIPQALPLANCADLVIIRLGPNLDPWFLASIFNSQWGRSTVAGNLVGVAQQHFNVGAAKEMLVSVPSLQTQRTITSILKAYDDLIENNARRIKILEQMAQAIYREWFVEFRAPGVKLRKASIDEKKVTRKDDVPRDWQFLKVEDIVERVPSGKKYDTNTVSPTGLVPVLDQGKTGIIGYHDDEPGVVASEDEPIIVFANHTCYQKIIQFPFSAIQNMLPFVSNSKFHRDLYWLHWATKDLIKFNDYKGHWPEFMSKRLLLPPEEICSEFGKMVKPMVQAMYKLELKNANLRRTRDLLLPRLISGEVDVEKMIVNQ